jgi:type IV secretion system protein VirB6
VSSCPTLSVEGQAGIAEALRVVDCVSAEGTAKAFGRLFGADGSLVSALTLLLTLYIGLLAVNLLTGRSKLGLNMLTPRMLGLGLVLTFATSWVAYQSVVWTLLTGAPDQVAAVVTGQQGSATAAFADQLDALFAAVAQAADAAKEPLPLTDTGITPAPPQAAGWTAADVLWMAAMLLLLGTVGVLLVARIALAALLALGPVFIVMALFRGTHGLFVGWLKGAVMFALVPLFTVLIGGSALALLAPIVASLSGGPVSMQAAVTMFLGAAVYVALMVIVLKVSGAMVSGWSIGTHGRAEIAAAAANASAPAAAAAAASNTQAAAQLGAASAGAATSAPPASDRVRAIVAGTRVPANDVADGPVRDVRVTGLRSVGVSAGVSPNSPATAVDRRVQGIGTRFRPPPTSPNAGRPKS